MAEFAALHPKQAKTENSHAEKTSFAIQRKCGCGNPSPQGESCSACAAKASVQSDVLKKPTVSLSSSDQAPDGVMPESLRQRARETFGNDMPNVNFFTGGAAQNYARRLQAKAFTAGSDVYFGSGFYRPDTPDGLRLIGHELTHVVQQRRGLAFSKLQGEGDTYEQEADRGGDAFAEGKPFRISSPQGSIGRATQRMGAGESAAAVGTENPSHNLEFIGEMWEQEELVATMDSFRSMEDESHKLILIPESAVESFGSYENEGAPPLAQAKLLDSASNKHPTTRPIIQRAIVAGCNVPAMSANQIGIAAHMQIGGACGLLHAASQSSNCLGGGHPGFQIPGSTRPDMVIQYPTGPFLDEVGEIKPASWLNPLNNRQAVAEAQLNADIANYRRIIGSATSMWSFAFPRVTFLANPTQYIRVWPATGASASNGVHYYSCYNKPRRRPHPIPIRIPHPVPVVNPQPVRVPRVRTRPLVEPEVVVGAAATVGIGYLIYRGVRMLPSLAPPLWPTIPANLAIP
ncbi:eCIS core domain-containing protein [Enterovibrio coralii]|uniref:DUF4157 domain-containing protein n=1 Tax=Enterovibrio coralii TaxID=294935 RepID=A0A135IC30_9GAMM|nr:DUF4157 domain-containing protein [Enterovibrio coralii]KXF83023.1 hypothetical protein ATN88_04615 [Enterovibrio coralii]